MFSKCPTSKGGRPCSSALLVGARSNDLQRNRAVLLLACAPAVTAGEDDWMLRTRLLFIQPNDDADGDLGDAGTEVDSDLTIEIDLTRFFGDNLAIEAILATAAQEVTQAGGDVSLGSVYHAPATVLAQYHFNPDGDFRPYIGAGLNLTIFYQESGALANLDLDSTSFGLAGQVGFDIPVGDDKVFNFDVKYIDIELDVDAGATALGTVDVNPLVVGVGFGFRF
ncbi:MAG: OmpW family protein [bacterium]|nr:OmpW family protein [bacterium]